VILAKHFPKTASNEGVADSAKAAIGDALLDLKEHVGEITLTVSREAIVAQLNMDMVGRGPDSLRVVPRTLQVIGSRRLSTQLGDAVESTNRSRATPFRMDYSYDAPRHPLNRYCRSDHYNYARHGIPIAYFSRGYHEGYHMVIDEPQYIDFEGLAEVAEFVRDVAVAIADRPERLVVNKPKMDPRAPCLQ